MNSELFNDFCRRGTEGKLELIEGKLIVGNTIVGSRLLLRQVLQGWGAEAAVALAPISLWIKALAASMELDQLEINEDDLRSTLLDLKAIAISIEYRAEDLTAGYGKNNYDHNSLQQKLTTALWQIGESLGGTVLGRDFVMRLGDNGFTPDLVFIAREHLHQLKAYYLDGAADLVIEVILPGHSYADKVAKKDYYQAGEVKEYWIIDPQNEQIEFWHNLDGKFHQQQLELDGCYRPSNIPGLVFLTYRLWQEARFDLELFRLEVAPSSDSSKIHFPENGLGWGELPFQPEIQLKPTPISFEQYICWSPEAKFEFFEGKPDIGGKTGIRNLIGMLLMTFGLTSSIKVLPPTVWCDALFNRLNLERLDEQRKTEWWQKAREVAAIIRESFAPSRIGVIGDLTKPEPLSYWSEITLVVWGLSEDKRWDIYSSLREINEDVPLSVIDVERDYLTDEQERNIESSLVEI